MEDGERHDASDLLSRTLEAVEMGPFNPNRRSRDRKKDRGVVRRLSDSAAARRKRRVSAPPLLEGNNLYTRNSSIAESLGQEDSNTSQHSQAGNGVYKDEQSTNLLCETTPEVPQSNNQTIERVASRPPSRQVVMLMEPPVRTNSWATLARGSLSTSSAPTINVASTTMRRKWRSFKI